MDKLQPPKTIREVGLVLSYMQEDIHDLKNIIRDQNSIYATRHELNVVDEKVDAIVVQLGGIATNESSAKIRVLNGREKLFIALSIMATAIAAYITNIVGK